MNCEAASLSITISVGNFTCILTEVNANEPVRGMLIVERVHHRAR